MLVTADGSVKLLDFGVAKLLGAQDGDEPTTVEQARPFTPEYASPEQLRDEPVAAASDVYSLGIVLYELLSGRRPFEVPSRSPIAALRAAETEPPRLRQLIGDELDNVVAKAIRADVDGAGSVRGFLVEADRSGFSASDIHGKWSLRASVTSSLTLEDVRVPAANLLPGATGLKSALMCLNQARYGISWGAMEVLA